MTRAGERCCAALPVPALEAHGRSAGALGHHIDLALTDTCRERGVKKREGEVSDTLIRVIKSFLTAPPHLHQTDIKHLLQCPLLNPDSTATTCRHGQLDCLPSTVAHSGACANLESTQF